MDSIEEIENEKITTINVPEGIFLYSRSVKSLIFKGFIPFKPGPLYIKYKDKSRIIIIKSRTYCQVWDAVIENTEFNSREDLTNYLSFYYNDVTMRTPLTIIKYR